MSLVFGLTFPRGNYWNLGRGYLETEKLGIIPDSLTKLGDILEFRDCKGMRTLEIAFLLE